MKKLLCTFLTIALISSATAYAAPETVLETETVEETAISVDAAFAAEETQETIDYNAPLYGVKFGYTDFSDVGDSETPKKLTDGTYTIGTSGVFLSAKVYDASADTKIISENGDSFLRMTNPAQKVTVGFKFRELSEGKDAISNDERFTVISNIRTDIASKRLNLNYRLTNKIKAITVSADGNWETVEQSYTVADMYGDFDGTSNLYYAGIAIWGSNLNGNFDVTDLAAYRMPAAGTAEYKNILVNGKTYSEGMSFNYSDSYNVSFVLEKGLEKSAAAAILDAPEKYYPGATSASFSDNVLTLTFSEATDGIKLISLANADATSSYPEVSLSFSANRIDSNAPLYGVKIGYTDFSNFTETTSVSTSADIQSGSGLAFGTIWNTTGTATGYSASASVVVENGEKYLHVVGPKNGFSLGYFIDYDAETNTATKHDETDKSLYTAITTARSNLETSGFAYRITNRAHDLKISDTWNDYAVSHTINDEEQLSNPGSNFRTFDMVGYALLNKNVTDINTDRYLDFKTIGVYKMPEDTSEYTYNTVKNVDGTYTVIVALADGLEKNAADAINANPAAYFGDNVTAEYDAAAKTLALVADADANSVTLIRLANANGTASYKQVTVAMPKAPEIKDEIDYSDVLNGMRFHAVATSDSRADKNVAEYGWIVTRQKIVTDLYNGDETKFNFTDMNSNHYVTGVAFNREDEIDKVFHLDVDTLNAEFTGIVKGIDESKFADDVIIAKPYLKFADGTCVYGSARKATINTAKNGEFSK